MTTSNICKTLKRFNIPFSMERVKKLSHLGAEIEVNQAVITKGLISTLIDKVISKGMVGVDGQDISIKRNELINNLRKYYRSM